jgi:hypothetical protein
LNPTLQQIQQLATQRLKLATPRQHLLPLNGQDVPAQCPIRDDLVAREELLRLDIKIEPTFRRQLLLAQSILKTQKARFHHSETCPTCQQIELEEAG